MQTPGLLQDSASAGVGRGLSSECLAGRPGHWGHQGCARQRERVSLGQEGERAVWPLVGGMVVIVGPHTREASAVAVPKASPGA